MCEYKIKDETENTATKGQKCLNRKTEFVKVKDIRPILLEIVVWMKTHGTVFFNS